MSAVEKFGTLLFGDDVAKTESRYASIIENLNSAQARKDAAEKRLVDLRGKLTAIVEGEDPGDAEKVTREIVTVKATIGALEEEVAERTTSAARGKDTLERARQRAVEANVERLVAAARTAAEKAEEKLEPKLREIRAIVDEAFQAHQLAYNAAHNARMTLPGDLALDVQKVAGVLNHEVRTANQTTWGVDFSLLVPRA